MSPLFCSSCGEPNEDSGRFCFACGSRLTRSGPRDPTQTSQPPRSAPPPARSLAGTRLAHYRIVELIGRGGFGEVYRADDENLGRPVALKVLPAEVAGDPDRLERFRREARTVAALNHPNIVTVHSIETSEGVPFLTMELIEGRSLGEAIPEGGLDPRRFMELALALARALGIAHGKGITHRDLKPGNIMVDGDGRVKILDFGLAKMHRAVPADGRTMTVSGDLTAEGVILGTMAYMAPEQVQGRPAGPAADVFSFGLVLYQMATGRRAFTGHSAAELMSAILRDEPPSLADLRPDYPREVVQAVLRCLRKEPEARFANAGELARALGLAESSMLTAATLASAPPRRRFGLLPAAAVVAVVAVLAVAAWFGLGRRGDETASPAAGPRRIVVLPMVNLGPPEEAYFAAGLTDEITSRLGTIAGLGVVSRTTAVQYLGTTKSLREIGEELEVDYALEGSVRWQQVPGGAGRVRATAQLVRVADDTQVWSDSYDRAIEDIFEVQSAIAAEVIGQLDLTLLAGERAGLEARPTESIEAYQAYLRGLESFNRAYSTASDDQAIEVFERAVELDPDFALAWAMLGTVHARVHGSGRDRSDERRHASRSAADRALALDPDLPEAHMALGYYLYWVELQYGPAIAEFEIALRGMPSNTQVLAGIAFASRRAGDLDRAVECLDRVLALDPRFAHMYIEHALTFLWLRDFPRANALLDRSIALDPGQQGAYVVKGEIEWSWQGRLALARETLEQVRPDADGESAWTWYWQLFYERDFDGAARLMTEPGPEPITWWYSHPRPLLAGLAHRFAGRNVAARAAFEEARATLERQIVATGGDRVSLGRLHGALGIARAGLGECDEALRHGRQAMELHSFESDRIATGRLVEMATIQTTCGAPEDALELLDRLLAEPTEWTLDLVQIDPRWDALRDHPGYARLFERYRARDL